MDPLVRLDALDQKRRAEAAIKELELAERRGELIPAADVLAAQAEVADLVREACLGIAAEAVNAGIVPPDRERDLDAVVRRALRSLAEKA